MSEPKADIKPTTAASTPPSPAPAKPTAARDAAAPTPTPATPSPVQSVNPVPTPTATADPAVAPTPTAGTPTAPAPAPTPTPTAPAPPKPTGKPDKPDKPKSLQKQLADIRSRVEAISNRPFLDGKAEDFADAWADLDDIGTSDKPAEAAQIQAAHNHLQHHAPRRASQIDALEHQLDQATDDKPRPQAVPDSPQLTNVKRRIAELQTDIANDPRALPEDVERAQALQDRVDELTAEKATAGTE